MVVDIRKKLNYIPISIKINSRWINNLNVRSKTLKYLMENVRDMQKDINHKRRMKFLTVAKLRTPFIKK